MRLPNTKYMERLVDGQNSSLISYINAKVQQKKDRVRLIPFIFEADNTFHLFNDRLFHLQVTPSAETFQVMESDNGTIANSTFGAMSPQQVLEVEFVPLVQGQEDDFTTGD